MTSHRVYRNIVAIYLIQRTIYLIVAIGLDYLIMYIVLNYLL
jgi:hypothetical protein